jgi:enoyl-CoA hydratase/carnithine racemase
MRCEVDGHLARLRLNRPEVLNAANWAWVQDLVTATDYFAQNKEIRVLIVSGEGRAFCSGLDVKDLARGDLPLDWFVTWERGVMALTNLPVITIAAVHGYCLGGGLQVALACDLFMASSDAIFSIPAVKEGVVAALGPMRLTRLIGVARAKYLCFLGRRFSPQEALDMGLVHEVVAPADLEQHVLKMAQELLEIPFTALLLTKRQIDRALEYDTATLFNELIADQDACLHSAEHAEVMAKYREEQVQRQRQKEQAM